MFFRFHQNNSGGSFDIDDERGIGPNVYIEAADASEANIRAESIGIYFDGVASGYDCSCCGDRWHSTWEDEGTETVEINEYSFGWHNTVYCHAKDGTILRFTKEDYRKLQES